MAKAMEGTLTEASKTLDASIKQAEQGQRAWVTITFSNFEKLTQKRLLVRKAQAG